MKRLLVIVTLLMAGCATTETGMEAGPYTMAEYTVPKCSKVTVSSYSGPNRWIECQVR